MHPFVAALVGGGLVGLAAVLLMAVQGRILGVSGIVGGLLPPALQRPLGWRVAFVVGVLIGPLVAGMLGFPFVFEPVVDVAGLAVAGLLVGMGTALGSGCTSGHGVCGIARCSGRSVLATVIFMVAAAVTVFVVRHGGGL